MSHPANCAKSGMPIVAVAMQCDGERRIVWTRANNAFEGFTAIAHELDYEGNDLLGESFLRGVFVQCCGEWWRVGHALLVKTTGVTW